MFFVLDFYCGLLQHVSAPIGDHLQVKCTQKNIFKVTTVYVNGSEHEKHLLRTVVLIKVLVDTRATGCITQQLSSVNLAVDGIEC
jgi:hypothetical protein